MKLKIKLLTGVLGLLLSASGIAQSIDVGLGVGTAIPFGGDAAEFYNPGFSWGLLGTYNLKDLTFGLSYSSVNFGVDDLGLFFNDLSFTINTVNVHGLYNVINNSDYQVALGLGLGFSSTSLSSTFSYGPRARFNYLINDNIGVLADVPLILTEGENWLGLRIGGFYRIDNL